MIESLYKRDEEREDLVNEYAKQLLVCYVENDSKDKIVEDLKKIEMRLRFRMLNLHASELSTFILKLDRVGKYQKDEIEG